MNKRFKPMMPVRSLFVTLALLLSVGFFATSAHAQDPRAAVQKLLDAMTAKDAATIRALFAANAEQRYGNGAPKNGKAFKRWVESDVIRKEAKVEDAQLAVKGNEVTVTGQISNNVGYRSKADFLMKLDSAGKIVSWQIRY
ncbi:MAG: nuclear transport factor 2 family protein [Bosea sp. (in: a-proteobacteria)]